MKITKTTAPVVRTFSEYLPEPFIDEVSETEKYIGYAPIGTDEDEEGWRIVKVVKEGNVTKHLYAQGTMDFISAWDKRTEYSYTR